MNHATLRRIALIAVSFASCEDGSPPVSGLGPLRHDQDAAPAVLLIASRMGQETGREKMAEENLLPRRVVGVTKKVTRTLVSIRTADAVVVATPEHPFAKVGAGWTPASQLAPGDMIVAAARPEGARVLAVTVNDVPPTEVYNLTVEKTHTYFVGSQELLVHNVGCFGWLKRKSQPPREGLPTLLQIADDNYFGRGGFGEGSSSDSSPRPSRPPSRPGSPDLVLTIPLHGSDFTPPDRLAVGLNPGGKDGAQLDTFSQDVHAKNYWDVYPRTEMPVKIVAARLLLLMRSAETIHFNLTGMIGDGHTLEQALESGAQGLHGKGNATNWELYKIVSNPDFMRKTTFYLNGVPFTFPPGLIPGPSQQQ
jgi:Pretoxin HINT domain